MADRISVRPSQPKIKRSENDLIRALRRHLRIEASHHRAVFVDGNTDLVGALAVELRILVLKSRNNTPLLRKLMTQTEIEVPVHLGDVPPGLYPGHDPIRGMSLEAYLAVRAINRRISTGELVSFTNGDLVQGLANKLGGAHEDWTIPEGLARIISDRVFIGDTQAALKVLEGISCAVAHVCVEFLKRYDERAGSK